MGEVRTVMWLLTELSTPWGGSRFFEHLGLFEVFHDEQNVKAGPEREPRVQERRGGGGGGWAHSPLPAPYKLAGVMAFGS